MLPGFGAIAGAVVVAAVGTAAGIGLGKLIRKVFSDEAATPDVFGSRDAAEGLAGISENELRKHIPDGFVPRASHTGPESKVKSFAIHKIRGRESA